MRKLRRLARSRWTLAIVSALVGAIVGAIIGLIPFWVSEWHQADERRQEEAIAGLVYCEAMYVLDRNVEAAVSLYSDDAIILDAAAGQKWSGTHDIRVRYLTLPIFIDLKHPNINARLGPAEGSATAISDTIGSYLKDGVETLILADQEELWTFVKVKGEWKIDTFVYGLPSPD